MRDKRLLLLLFSALILRLLGLNQSFWLDEGVAALTVKSMTFAQYFHEFLPGDFHPPLYFIVQKIFFIFFGDSEVVFRLPAIISGTVLVWIIFLISKEVIKHKSVVYYPAVLTASSPLLVYYSAEARPYSLTALIVAINFLTLIRLIKSKNLKSEIFFFSTAFILIFLNYLSYIYLLFSFSFYYFYLYRKKRFNSSTFFLSLASLIASALILPILIQQFAIGSKISQLVPGWESVIGNQDIFKNFLQFPIKIVTGLVDFNYSPFLSAFTVVVVLCFAVVIFKRVKNRQFDHILLISLGSFFTIILLGAFYPVYSYFRLIFLIPFVYLIICSAQISLRLKTALFSLILLSNCLFLFLFFSNPSFWKENWKDAKVYTDYLFTKFSDASVLFSTSKAYDVFTYYNNRPALGSSRNFTILDDNDLEKEKILEFKHIIYYDYLSDLTDPQKLTLYFLQNNYNELEAYSFNKIGTVRLFEQK